jgi:hypothetical protein
LLRFHLFHLNADNFIIDNRQTAFVGMMEYWNNGMLGFAA